MNTLTDIISEARNSPETCDKNLLLVINELERVKKDNSRLRAEWLQLHNNNTATAKSIDELEEQLANERANLKAYDQILDNLRKQGIIDQLCRPLPLEGHHKDCPHGQNGWSMCTCDVGCE